MELININKIKYATWVLTYGQDKKEISGRTKKECLDIFRRLRAKSYEQKRKACHKINEKKHE